MDALIKRLDEIERLVKSLSIAYKKVFTFSEACDYCGYTASHMYKLTCRDAIPHYKPNGKMIFFMRSELDAWLLRNRNITLEEVKEAEACYLNKKRRGVMQEVINQLMMITQDLEVIKAYVLALEKSRAERLKEEWIDNQDVIQALHISKRNLQTLRDNGTLPFSRINQKIYYKVTDLEDLLKRGYCK